MLMAKIKELTVTAIVSRNFTPDPLSQFYIMYHDKFVLSGICMPQDQLGR